MKYSTLLLFLLWGELFAMSEIKATDNSHQLPDSILTKDHIYEYTFTDPDKARQIIRQMRYKKTISEYSLNIAEGDLLFNNGKYNDALVYYERVLASDSVHSSDTEYMEQLHRMISCYDCLHDEAKKSNYVEQLLKTAKLCGNKEMEAVALFNMGKMLYYQGDKRRGYNMVKKGISLMEHTNYKYKYDNLRYNYNTLLIMQQQDKKDLDALETLNQLERIVTETTKSEPKIDDLAKKEIKTMYAQRTVLLSNLGRMSEADQAYYHWKIICPIYTKDDYLIAPYLIKKGLYDEVIRIYTSREIFLEEHKDTVNYHMRTIKRELGRAYEEKKDYQKSTKYFKELAILTDSLKKREQQSAALELATVYETHQTNLELERQSAQVEIQRILLLSMGVALLLLLLFFIRNAQYTRTIRLKNAAMVNTVQELLANKKGLYDLKPTDEEPVITDEDEEEYQLFKTLDHRVVCEKLYLDPNISREELMKLIHVDKNKFGRIIQQYTRTNTTGYINGKRLEYAVELLKKHPEYTISSIAQSCGIPNIPTFNRLFRAKFAMTPSELKKQL